MAMILNLANVLPLIGLAMRQEFFLRDLSLPEEAQMPRPWEHSSQGMVRSNDAGNLDQHGA